MRQHLSSVGAPGAAAVLSAAFTLVAAVDLLSPPYITFGAFYLLIVSYAAWALGRVVGYLFAVAVVAVGVWSDGLDAYVMLAPGQAQTFAVAWSLSMRLLSSAAVIELVRGFRHSFDQAQQLSDTDALTGLLNRRAFAAAATRQLRRVHAAGRVGIILYADLDGFKQVNDQAGHAAGDAVLGQVARALVEATRPTDLLARNGGDEFALWLDAPDQDSARQLVLRLRTRVTDALGDLAYPGLSCSVGAALALPDAALPELDSLLREADRLMYQAKRNRFAQLSETDTAPCRL